MAASDQIYLGTVFTNNDPDTAGVRPGDVVELDTSLDAAVRKIQVANSTNVLGVVVVGGSQGARITICGFTGQRIRVNVASAEEVAVGDRLVTDGIVAGRATVDNAAESAESFAIAITSKAAGIDNKVECLYTTPGLVNIPTDTLSNGYFVVTRTTSAPVNSTNLGALTTGLLKSTVSSGISTLSIGVGGTDFQAPLSAANATIVFPTANTVRVGVLSNNFIVQGTTDANLSGAQFLGALTTGLVKNTTTSGVLSIATAGIDYQGALTAADTSIVFPTPTTIAVNELTHQFIVRGTSNALLPNAQFTGLLTTGIVKNTTTTGALSIAVANTDFADPDARYVVTNATDAPINATNLGALTSGLLKQTVSTGTATITIAVAGTDYVVPSAIPSGTFDRVSVATSGLVTAGITTLVANIAALEALVGANYRVGSRVYVLTLQAEFTLATSSLTVDDITVASVSGASGSRWLRVSERSRFWEARTTWYVDPANVTATASDEGDGATSGTALRTWSELGRRLFYAQIDADVTVNMLSDTPNTDPLLLTGVSTISSLTKTFTIIGSPTVIASGRTISTPRNPAAADNDHYEITDATTFTPWLQNYLLHRTSGTEVWFWPYKDLGSNKLHVSPPITAGNALSTFVNGDTYEILSLPTFADVFFGGGTSNVQIRVRFAKVIGVGSYILTQPTPESVVYDRCLLATRPFLGGDANSAIYLQNVCLPATAGGINVSGRWVNFGGLFCGDGTTTIFASTEGYYLGGDAQNLITLGGIRMDIQHDARAEKIAVMTYDWAGSPGLAAINVSHHSWAWILTLGGARNTGDLVAVNTFSSVGNQIDFTAWNAAITTDANPYVVGANHYNSAQLGIDTDQMATTGMGIINYSGTWTNDLSGIGTNPSVVAIHESGANTQLTIGTIADTQYLARSGTTVTGVFPIPASSVATVVCDGILTGATQLSTLASASYTEGATAWVKTVGTTFILEQTSTLTPDNITVVSATGKSGYVWRRQDGVSGYWWQQLTWHVKPVTGSDEADGASSGTAIKTFAELKRRLFLRFTPSAITSSITINLYEDTPSTDYLQLWSATSIRGGTSSCTVLGIPTVADSGVIASIVARDMPNNIPDQITITGFDWSTHVGKIIRRQGTTGTSSQTAVVLKDLGSGSARISTVNVGLSAGTAFSVSETVEVLTLPVFPGANIGPGFNFVPVWLVDISPANGGFRSAGSTGGALISSHVGANAGSAGLTSTSSFGLFGCSIHGAQWTHNGPCGGGRLGLVDGVVGVNQGLTGRNEFQDISLQGNSRFEIGETMYVRFHEVGMFDLPAAGTALKLRTGAVMTSSTYFYGSGNHATSYIATLDEAASFYSGGPHTSWILADPGLGFRVNPVGVDVAVSALPYGPDENNNRIVASFGTLSNNRYITQAAVTGIAGQSLGSLTTGLLKNTVSGSVGTLSTAAAGTDYQAPGNYITALTGDVTATGPGSVAATIANDAVTYAKMQNVSAASKLLGRGDSGSGDVQEITIGTGLAMTGTTLSATALGLSDGDYGDIIVSGTGTVWTIDNDVVTNAKLANVATATFKGRVTGSTGDPEDLTGTQATTLLDIFTSGLKGLAPSSGGGSTNFLRADGTWAAPAGTSYTFSTGLTNASGTITANISTGVSTGQSAIGGTGSGEALTLSSTSHGTKGQIRFGDSTNYWDEVNGYQIFGKAGVQVIEKQGTGDFFVGTLGAQSLGFYTNNTTWATISSAGKLTYPSTTGLVFDPATNVMTIGNASPVAAVGFQYNKNVNSGVSFLFSNPNTGGSAYSSFQLAQSATLASGANFGSSLLSSGSTFGAPYTANAIVHELSGSTGNFVFWIDQASGDYFWYTGTTFPNPDLRMKLTNAGVLSVPDLSGGGVVQATVTTGALSENTITAELITFGHATNGGLTTFGGLAFDTGGDGYLSLSDDVGFEHFNLGSRLGDTNSERVTGKWIADVWTLKSLKSGSGTVRPMTIDADTASLTIDGGSINVGTLTAGGVVKAAASSGELGIASAGLDYDLVSFHFFIDEVSNVGSFDQGVLVPSESTAVTTFGAADVSYAPGNNSIFSRGELLVFLIANGVTTGSYNIQVTLNGVSISSSVLTVTSSSTGRVVSSFSTGSASATDVYELIVNGSVGIGDYIQYTLVFRLFTN